MTALQFDEVGSLFRFIYQKEIYSLRVSASLGDDLAIYLDMIHVISVIIDSPMFAMIFLGNVYGIGMLVLGMANQFLVARRPYLSHSSHSPRRRFHPQGD